jgi:Domain of unknown function (DUF4169)
VTAELVNLRAVRKTRDRKTARVQSTANAAKHGRSKAEQSLEQARTEKAARALDGAKRETD